MDARVRERRRRVSEIDPRGLLLTAVLAVFLALGVPAASASLYHYYDGVPDPPPSYPTGGREVPVSNLQWTAQSFRASASYSLTRIALWAQYTGNASESATAEVRSDAGSRPDMVGPPITLDSRVASSTYRWVNFTFAVPVRLVAGLTYWLLLRNSTGVSSAGWNWWNTRADTYVDPGQGLTSLDGGLSWGPGGVGDFVFRAFGYEETSLRAALATNRTDIRGGDSIRLTLWLNNSGTEVAERAWVNLSLPSGLTLTSDNASSVGGTRTPGTTGWIFANVEGGSRYFLVIAFVGLQADSGFQIIRATLEYTDFLGVAQPGSVVTTTIFVTGGGLIPADPILIAAAASVPGVLLVFASRRFHGKVEEVFLIHTGGVLIVHLSRTLKGAKDRDVLAGMLTAIQHFVRDAFTDWTGGDIRQIDFGSQKILIARGDFSYLAAVVRGRGPGGLASRLKRSIAELEDAFRGVFEDWDGDMDSVSGADEILRQGLFEGGFAALTRGFIRNFAVRGPNGRAVRPRPRSTRKPGNLERQAGLQRWAYRLKQRRELGEIEERYGALVATALEEIWTGRFTVCGFANVYLATLNQESPGRKWDVWWTSVLTLVRDVMKLWEWDPKSQAWVSATYPAPPPRAAEGPAGVPTASPSPRIGFGHAPQARDGRGVPEDG